MIKIIISFFLIFNVFCFAEEDILEKSAKNINGELQVLRGELKKKYEKASNLYEKKAKKGEFYKLLEEIKAIKSKIISIESKWRESFVKDSVSAEEAYAFWDQGETTISELIMEYGSTDYLYIIPQTIGSLKITMFSSIPIPQDSWNEMIELILSNNGIGIKKLTPYLRKLFIFKHDLSNIEAIASNPKDLEHLPDNSVVFFIFAMTPEKLKESSNFFERFSDPKQTSIQIVGNKLVIISPKKNIKRLLKLHNAVLGKEYDKVVKVVGLTKINAKEVEKVIKAFFLNTGGKRRPPFFKSFVEEVSIFPSEDNNSVILIGENKMVKRTIQIIEDIENQVEDFGEMTIFWYTCKHSDPQDIADILNRVYASFSSIDFKKETPSKNVKREKIPLTKKINKSKPSSLPIAPTFVKPGKIERSEIKGTSDNFIVDPKTGSILMVVRKEYLEKIKNLLKKLDVPKKMVQIDVLLVERKIQDRKQSGINILKIGTKGNKREKSFTFDASKTAATKGILDFIFSKPKDFFPSFDLTLSFLMAQEDLKINANPSILAINQTPATINIVEELSINQGAVQTDTSKGVSIEKSYTRAQFGIFIVMTPIINLPDEKSLDKKGYITLQTDITFDTTHSTEHDRPPVTRRHIESEVRIADGETIILGGLRRKTKGDSRDKIPFLGDIPGIGKLFGTTKLTDSSTEMFIFITPRIIKDPVEDLKIQRQRILKQRPGDIPEFLKKMEESENNLKKKLFESSMKVLFD
jgi:general secretion pathway protein D